MLHANLFFTLSLNYSAIDIHEVKIRKKGEGDMDCKAKCGHACSLKP